MTTPSISVAMATWNGAAYLPEQLDSLAKQELLPSELVVRDDGSTDSTLEVLAQFAERAPFAVHVSSNPRNLGVRSTFEKAISLCIGDIIFLCDQDDYWAPEKIRRVVETFERDARTMVVLNDKRIADERLNPSAATVLGNMRRAGTPDISFIAGCCSAYRREWLPVALPIPSDLPYHDWWIAALAHQLGVSHILDEPLQLYRRHESNASVHPHYQDRPLGLRDRLRGELGAMSGPRRRSLREFWAKDVAAHDDMARRIEDRLPALAAMGLEAKARDTLERLKARNRVARARLAAVSSPWHRRVKQIWSLWRSGDYAQFSGWKSAVKDLVQ
ncbi:MAG TPA: glycosyltransferase family 2 protein [Allosphingosinicella sp.]|nr:glycosyltransferase family 2 protein [Allosphingosinicella sp.]